MIESSEQLQKELNDWMSSEDETDPIIQVPLSIINKFRYDVQDEMYLHLLKNKKEEIEKQIRRLEYEN